MGGSVGQRPDRGGEGEGCDPADRGEGWEVAGGGDDEGDDVHARGELGQDQRSGPVVGGGGAGLTVICMATAGGGEFVVEQVE